MLSLDFLDDVRRMNKRQVPEGPGGPGWGGKPSGRTGPVRLAVRRRRGLTHPLPPQLYYQVLNFGMIVSSALMIWKGLMVVTGSESPIVVVLRSVPGCGGLTWLGNGRGPAGIPTGTGLPEAPAQPQRGGGALGIQAQE